MRLPPHEGERLVWARRREQRTTTIRQSPERAHKESEMDRRSFLEMSAAGVLGALAGSASPLNGQERPVEERTGTGTRGSLQTRPNIVLFMPDEMRADSLACYGNAVTRTPNFDRLAREGTRFSNCHVQFPVCGASRCSMLTGWQIGRAH